MSAIEVETSITLSAVIPIGGFPNGDTALKSWLLQTLPVGMEVLLVLDSNEKSVIDSVQSLASSNYGNKITVLNSIYRNPGSTRNIGLQAARGKWVCFWDADDVPDVTNVWRNAERGDNQQADIVVGTYVNIDFESKKQKNHLHGSSDPLMDIYLNPGIWRFIFKREVIQEISFPALKMGEDQVFLLKALSKSNKNKFVGENFYNYYQYCTGQLTKSEAISKDLMQAHEICKELYKETPTAYLSAALIRQNMTLIKRGKTLGRTRSLSELIFFTLGSAINFKILILILKKVLREKK